MEANLINERKKRAAEYAVAMVKDSDIVGLGTGSTAKFAIEALALRVREGLNISGVATSLATERMAREFGIKIIDLATAVSIDISIDGADEIDPAFNMIKGGGGALTREKLVALASKHRVFIVDETKLVRTLGQSFKLPVEVLPFGWSYTSRLLNDLGYRPAIRLKDQAPFETDNGNYILDCEPGLISDPATLETKIKLLPGVIENGLFVGIADTVIIGFADRVEERHRDK